MRIAILFMLCMQMLLPAIAYAQATLKDPLNYPLRQYGFMLGTALLGGLVSWYAKVRKGEIAAWSINQLIGELATSAFAGLLAFWLCESMSLAPLVTASLVGIAGHMGTRAIQGLENFAQKRWPFIAGRPPEQK
jgi:hypothetical protein